MYWGTAVLELTANLPCLWVELCPTVYRTWVMTYCYLCLQDPSHNTSVKVGGLCFAAVKVQQGAEDHGAFQFCRLGCFWWCFGALTCSPWVISHPCSWRELAQRETWGFWVFCPGVLCYSGPNTWPETTEPQLCSLENKDNSMRRLLFTVKGHPEILHLCPWLSLWA